MFKTKHGKKVNIEEIKKREKIITILINTLIVIVCLAIFFLVFNLL